MLSAEMIGRPDSARIFLPSSTLVPFEPHDQRHLESFTSRAAATTPSAIMSHFMMPPKMLTRIAFTFGFVSMILNASVTFSVGRAAADVEEVRRLAAEELDVSIVAIASPAPLTRQPMLPSSEMYDRSNFDASISAGSSSSRSRIATMSGWRNSALSSKLIFASSATTLPSPVTISGLISASDASVSSNALVERLAAASRACGDRRFGNADLARDVFGLARR